MKKLLFLLLVPFLFSCKEPVPLYFNSIPGTPVDSLPHAVCGSFISLEDVRNELADRKTDFPNNPGDNDFLQFDTTASGFDTVVNSYFSFNELSCSSLLSRVDSVEKKANRRIAFGVLRIVPKGLDFDFVDSLGVRSEVQLLRFNAQTKLSKYKEDYFIAQKAAHGWELMLLDFQHNDLVSIRLPWYDKYSSKATDKKSFLASMKYLGAKLTVVEKDGRILGLKTSASPDQAVDLLKKSETSIDLIRY